MKKIAQISDLHFSTEDLLVTEGLIKELNAISPDVIAISGDLTQRARTNQFLLVRAFLEKLKAPKIIIPGNHDIPLFDLIRRFIAPLNRYKRLITSDMNPLYEDDEIAVLGINTARSLTWKEGRISVKQIKDMEKVLCRISNDKLKIIVTHHPFIPPPGSPGIKIVGRSVSALRVIDECHVDLLLAGHLHQGYSGDVRPYYPSAEHSVISVQAGTAISNRRRNEPNAYNLISVDKGSIIIEIKKWDGNKFYSSIATSYKLINKEWIKTAGQNSTGDSVFV
jgi:3',5'-cyclic AMP phosphodiesterase CpdA